MPVLVNNKSLYPAYLLTPNSDGKNDTWIIKIIAGYLPVTKYIFDLSGRIVMSSRNYNTDCNGGFRGASLSLGTYYY